MRAVILILVAVAVTMATAGSALAAKTWRPEQTVDYPRGSAAPDVAVARDGRAALVFSSADRGRLELWVRRAGTPEPFVPGAATPPGGATNARIAMNPAGVTAVAALEAGRVFVTMYPGDAQARYRGKVVAVDAPGVADQPKIAVDAAGRATVVWASPPAVSAFGFSEPRQVYAVTVGPDAVAGPVQALGEPGYCDPALDVNLRGDAVVAVNCRESGGRLFFRPAGGDFGVASSPFGEAGEVQVALDGAGAVHAVQTTHVSVPPCDKYGCSRETRLAYAVRPPEGSFSVPEAIHRPDDERVSDVDLEVQESGRVVLGWLTGERFVYAVRAAGGAFWARTAVGSVRAAAHEAPVGSGADVVASANGPVLLVWQAYGAGIGQRVRAALLRDDGSLGGSFASVRGELAGFPAFAINDSGQVAGAWEQRCGTAHAPFAVMAVQRDTGGRPSEPPCQDRKAPEVALSPRHAAVSGRRLRVRFVCGEACRYKVRAVVRRAGRRKPIAVARTARARRLAGGQWRRLGLRLSRAEARRVARLGRGRRKLSVRLALSVRDVYGTGRTWRFRLPLRR